MCILESPFLSKKNAKELDTPSFGEISRHFLRRTSSYGSNCSEFWTLDARLCLTGDVCCPTLERGGGFVDSSRPRGARVSIANSVGSNPLESVLSVLLALAREGEREGEGAHLDEQGRFL